MSTDKFATNQLDDSSSTSLLWKYVTKLEKANDNDGNIVFRCKYCDNFKGSYLRVKTPLLEQSGHGVQPYVKVVDESINSQNSSFQFPKLNLFV